MGRIMQPVERLGSVCVGGWGGGGGGGSPPGEMQPCKSVKEMLQIPRELGMR